MAAKFAGYRLTRLAEADLEDIYAYSAGQWGTRRADLYVRDLHDSVSALCDGGKAGRPVVGAEDYLSLRVGSHMVIYREAELIIVVRILHGAMDVAGRLAP